MIIDEKAAIVLDTNMINAFFEGDPIDVLDTALDKAAGDLHGDPHNEVFILIKVVKAEDIEDGDGETVEDAEDE